MIYKLINELLIVAALTLKGSLFQHFFNLNLSVNVLV